MKGWGEGGAGMRTWEGGGDEEMVVQGWEGDGEVGGERDDGEM